MKITPKSKAGNVLFATLFTTGILSLFVGGYLTLVRSENNFTFRSQTWNAAIPIAEAGIEEGLAQLRATFPTLSDANGWTKVTGSKCTYYTNQYRFNNDEYYNVIIFPAGGANETTPVIVSQGFSRVPMTTNYVSRTIRVNTRMDGPPMDGMVVVTTAGFNGNKIEIDSFNSTNGAFNTLGKYDVNKRGDKAILASLAGGAGAVNVGNGDIWGKIATQNGASPVIGSQSSVGNLAWHNANKLGLQNGAYINDINYAVQYNVAPYTNAPAPLPLLGTYTLGTGTYKLDNLNGNILVTGKAKLLVTTTCNIDAINIVDLTGNASLELYVAAKDATISGSPNVNGKATNFKYIGLPANPALNWEGNQTLTCGGNGEFTAMVNAPGTALTLKGGGNTVQDFSGACLVKSLEMKGHYKFHFDEACASAMDNQYIAISWDELAVSTDTILAKNLITKSDELIPYY